MMLEKVRGVELWQVGEIDRWIDVAAWLARLHGHFSAHPPSAEGLIRYDRSFFQIWPTRAQRKHPTLVGILAKYEHVVEILCAQPLSLMHGEFYASNVMLDGD